MNNRNKSILAVLGILLLSAIVLYSFKIPGRLGGGKNPVSKAKAIKRNLEQDVRNLKRDARDLLRSKNSLIQLKDRINSELRQVENSLRKTEQDIRTTSRHVREIDSLIRMFR